MHKYAESKLLNPEICDCCQTIVFSLKKEEMHLRAEMLAASDNVSIIGRLAPMSNDYKRAQEDFKIARGEYEAVRDNLQALLNKYRKENLF